ncbi:hypothetical protein KFE98_00415 [bacterium SCSIO 12741]|nr:hypothetical protein KFE98_00415 [bacterium SCSIO 12741]
MCGIFGFVAKEKADLSRKESDDLLQKLFVLSETRGKESSGIAVRNLANQSIQVLKEDTPATELIKTGTYSKFVEAGFEGSFENGHVASPIAVTAHSRLVTNGSQENNDNNQPCIKDGLVMVHNGIVTNVDDLFQKFQGSIDRNYEVDTEILAGILSQKLKGGLSASAAVTATFEEIEGAASIAVQCADRDLFILATNTGSLYYWIASDQSLLIFGSEEYIMKTLADQVGLQERYGNKDIHWLAPRTGIAIGMKSFEVQNFTFEKTQNSPQSEIYVPAGEIKDHSQQKKHKSEFVNLDNLNLSTLEKRLEYNTDEIKELKRCKKCLLPETFPHIHFDQGGVCNYCNNYQTKGLKENKKEDLLKVLEKYRSKDGSPDCVIAFSGGRDSSFGLHYIVKELGMNPLTFTYDWGMVTDLARRNIARMTGKLGVENILVSADIKMKRRNIRLNVGAWLKQPRLGMIPLFMAGDKHFFVYVNKIRQQTGIPCDIWMENKLENTDFKAGFAGIKPNFTKDRIDKQSTLAKLQMPLYYAKNFMMNPGYINPSIPDTYSAFKAYYMEPRDVYLLLFDYIPWDEEEINTTLIDGYNWETSPDTTSTWRIGDGTAAFYNYVYYTVAGFTEFDTFRSNQIREGMITREFGMSKIYEENRPRLQSMVEYFSLIGLDTAKAIDRVNRMKKLYR